MKAFIVLILGILMFVVIILGLYSIFEEGVQTANVTENITEYEGLQETVNSMLWLYFIIPLGGIFYGFWHLWKKK